MKKGTPIIKSRPSSAKIPNYRDYKPKAKQYLDLEAQLRTLQEEEKALKKRIYVISNEMASISTHYLQLLGHRVVDDLRRKRNAKRTE